MSRSKDETFGLSTNDRAKILDDCPFAFAVVDSKTGVDLAMGDHGLRSLRARHHDPVCVRVREGYSGVKLSVTNRTIAEIEVSVSNAWEGTKKKIASGATVAIGNIDCPFCIGHAPVTKLRCGDWGVDIYIQLIESRKNELDHNIQITQSYIKGLEEKKAAFLVEHENKMESARASLRRHQEQLANTVGV